MLERRPAEIIGRLVGQFASRSDEKRQSRGDIIDHIIHFLTGALMFVPLTVVALRYLYKAIVQGLDFTHGLTESERPAAHDQDRYEVWLKASMGGSIAILVFSIFFGPLGSIIKKIYKVLRKQHDQAYEWTGHIRYCQYSNCYPWLEFEKTARRYDLNTRTWGEPVWLRKSTEPVMLGRPDVKLEPPIPSSSHPVEWFDMSKLEPPEMSQVIT